MGFPSNSDTLPVCVGRLVIGAGYAEAQVGQIAQSSIRKTGQVHLNNVKISFGLSLTVGATHVLHEGDSYLPPENQLSLPTANEEDHH